MSEQLTINIALGNPINIISMNVNDMLLALKYGADPNQTNQDGYTPLMFASHNGRAKIVELLLAHGVDINYANQDGETALTLASRHGHTEVVELLLAHGADVNHADQR